MEKSKRFEELYIWQISRNYSAEVYAIFKEKNTLSERPLSSQIIRSSGSIMDHIAEGVERGGNKEFLQYLWISKVSAGESRSQLYRAFDCQIIQESEFLKLKSKVESVSIGIYNLFIQIKNSEYKVK